MSIEHMSNQHILELVGSRFHAARLNKNITQKELAERSGVAQRTISNLEKGTKSVGLLNIVAILRALDLLDQVDRFMPAVPPRATALAKGSKHRHRLRERASGKRAQKQQPEQPWRWGDEAPDA